MADNALAKQVGKKMPERRKTRLEQIADEIQAYGGRVREDFMAGAERSAQGLGDIVERGDVLTGIPRLALGGTSWMGAPVSAALSPILNPILQPVGEAVNTYVGQPVEDLTGYPADITNDLAMTGLTLGAVKGLGVTRPYLARAADQVEGMANRAGYTFQPDPSVRFTFGGPTALTADKAKLARAKQMAKDGASSDDIFSETGWFKGVDDKWRFEIPDQQSQMTRDIGTKASVGDVLSHPKLFEAYPDLATIKLYGLRNQDEGMYMPQKSSAGEAIFVGDNNAHSTLLHELQHALQAREGFSSGARLKDNPKAKDISRYKRSAGEVEARNVETRLSLSPEQLTTQAFAPWRTADTAPYHQIVDKRSKGGSASYGSGPTLTPLVNEADGGLIAYHGSPHTFDKFSMDKIGTGEGAQAYGHGLYFAEAEDVAKTYRGMLSDQPQALPAIPWQQRMDWTEAQDDAYTLADRALEELQIDIMQGGSSRPDWSRLTDKVRQIAPRGKEDEIASALDELANRYGWKDFVNRNPGSMYQVRLNVKPDELLDWDKPLSEQPQNLLRRLENSPHFSGGGSDWGDMTTKDIVESLSGQDLISLKDQGIKGIRYKDAGSRGAEGGTYNYVIFDDSIIDILKRYGIPMTAAAGGGMMVMGQDMPPEVASQIGG
jgi:hypothetical protein